jgi:hypothetical protein
LGELSSRRLQQTGAFGLAGEQPKAPSWFFESKEMVEAAGVEPASRELPLQATTGFSRILRFRSRRLLRAGYSRSLVRFDVPPHYEPRLGVSRLFMAPYARPTGETG